MFWASPAAELRGMILEALAHEGRVAHCATVCREWQVALEKRNFRSLNLSVQDVPAFKALRNQTFGLIRYVWYSIELQEYDCTDCDLDETDATMRANQTLVEDGLREMLYALSERPSVGALALDISVHSLSDSQHDFKYIRFEPRRQVSLT
jgi:hypothetical protein